MGVFTVCLHEISAEKHLANWAKLLKELNALESANKILVWSGTAKCQNWRMQKSHRGPELSQSTKLLAPKCCLLSSLGCTNNLVKWFVLTTW